MIYFKCSGRTISGLGFQSQSWGPFIRYIEVAEDQLANRQVEVFKNGSILRYDRTHWCDDFAMLTRLKFSRKPKWRVFFPNSETITKTEFEKVWKNAQLWTEQCACSRASAWGSFESA